MISTYLLSVHCVHFQHILPQIAFFDLRSICFTEQYSKHFRCLDVFYRDVMSEISKASFTQQ